MHQQTVLPSLSKVMSSYKVLSPKSFTHFRLCHGRRLLLCHFLSSLLFTKLWYEWSVGNYIKSYDLSWLLLYLRNIPTVFRKVELASLRRSYSSINSFLIYACWILISFKEQFSPFAEIGDQSKRQLKEIQTDNNYPTLSEVHTNVCND